MSSDEPTKKKSKRKEKMAETEKEATPVPEPVEKKKKKRKREAVAEEDAPMADPETIEPAAKKKKHKNKTGFLDPSDDETLPEQSQKALIYAFTQFRKPKTWKFNKAKQNWLIRNVWSHENIPDPHMPLVLKYLANVQGGTRQNLIKVCETRLAKPVAAAASATAVEGAEVPEVPPSSAPDVRARELLDVLTAPLPTPDS